MIFDLFYLGFLFKRFINLNVFFYNWLDSTIWLKPAGVNLAEGDITDIGVEIDE